jgi:hypothetical protein
MRTIREEAALLRVTGYPTVVIKYSALYCLFYHYGFSYVESNVPLRKRFKELVGKNSRERLPGISVTYYGRIPVPLALPVVSYV